MLDVSPLSIQHGILFVGSFTVTFLVLKVLLALRGVLHEKGSHTIYLVGAVVITSIVTGSLYVLGVNTLWFGLTLAALLTLYVGTIDEHRHVTVFSQLLAQTVIAGVAVTAGWTIRYVSNPVGEGVIQLNWLTLGPWLIPGSLAAVLWLMFLMNALNWLDGVDGLAASVGIVVLLTLAAVSLLPQVQDARTLALALAGAGMLLGFVVWNWPPAYVYLGTSGSWFLGLYIGMVAILGGGKVITTLLVLSLPTLDTLSVIIQRLLAGHALWHGDVRHLHHRLLAAGLTPATVTTLITATSALLGAGALVLQTQQKMWALLVVGVVLASIVSILAYRQRQGHTLTYKPRSMKAAL